MALPIYSRRPSGRPLPHLRMENISNTQRDGSEVVTTVFVSNLHCSSCVHAIEDALSSLSPPPSLVDVSIVTQTVTVKHSPELSPLTVRSTVEEAGFDIVATPAEVTQSTPLSIAHSIGRIPSLLTGRSQKHLQQCSLCQAEHSANLGTGGGSSAHQAERERFGEDTLTGEAEIKKTIDISDTTDRGEKCSLSLNDRRQSVNVDDSVVQSGPQLVTLSVGGMTCASCSNAVTHALSELPGASNPVVNLLGNSATVTMEHADLVSTLVEAIEDIGYEAEVVTVEPINPPVVVPHALRSDVDGPLRMVLSVDGMTCASCLNTITDVLSAIHGVSNVAVNLLGRSASAVIERKELTSKALVGIEEAGYKAEVMSLEPIKSANGRDTVQVTEPRTISLLVAGMFCSHCPEKVMAAISSFGEDVTVVKPTTSHTDPIIRIRYLPAPPSFTLRQIIDAISSSASPAQPFNVSIHHPPSLEDRARNMQQREQQSLLQRLVFSVIVAIPTFIIAVVYMDLLPSSNSTRVWFERPMWTGNTSRATWALFFLATPIMFYSAGTFHRRSLKELWALWRPGSRTPVWRRFVRFGSMNLLVSTGVSIAYFASIVLLALAASEPASSSGPGDTTTYFDSVVFLTMFLLVGRFLEAYSKGRTADAITALGKLRATSALLVVPISDSSTSGSETASSQSISHDADIEKGDLQHEDFKLAVGPGSKVEKMNAELLEVGDIVRVQNGATPPADGTIVSGDSGAFDESSLTGESRLVKKQIGDKVFLGTINKAGVVDVRVDAIGGETMLDHIVKVVREGQTHRAPIERMADLLTGYFVPVITLLAIVTWVIWLGLGLGGALPQSYLNIDVGGWVVWSLEFAISVFVVACPCGIGLAAPTALLVGSGLAAKYGILARGGGEAFQETAQLDIIVFDKTGTLTQGGEPRVTDVEIVGHDVESRWTREVVLGIAAEMESASSHPLATAIRQYCADNSAAPQHASDFAETAGRGLRAKFDALHCSAIIGNEAWMEEHSGHVDGRLANQLDTWKSEGKSVVLLGLREESESGQSAPFVLAAIFAVADPLRPEAQDVIRHLHEQGIGTWMISGDNEITAKAVARTVGIPETNVIAGVLPHEKAEKIQWLQQIGMKRQQRSWWFMFGGQRLNDRCIVAMVGDGINDAPALTAADVGIAIGSGSDVAISSAAFILVSANLYTLLTLTDLSRKVFNRVKFNFLWATIYNIIAVPIAAGVIYPAGNARLPPVWASLSMALSSVSVVCSSLLLKLYKPPQELRKGPS